MRPIIPTLLLALLTACATVSPPKLPPAVPLVLHVLEQESVLVRLMDAPCVDAASVAYIARNVLPEYHGRFRAIESDWLEKDGSRKEYGGCWLDGEPEGVDGFYLVFSDNTAGLVPKSEFKKVKGGVGL